MTASKQKRVRSFAMCDVNSPPKRIFLQWEGTDHHCEGKIDTMEVTWASEKIWDTDVEYVLARKGRDDSK